MSVNFQTQTTSRFNNNLDSLSGNQQNSSQKLQDELLRLVVLVLQQVMKAMDKDGSDSKAGGTDGVSGKGGADGTNGGSGTNKGQGCPG